MPKCEIILVGFKYNVCGITFRSQILAVMYVPERWNETIGNNWRIENSW